MTANVDQLKMLLSVTQKKHPERTVAGDTDRLANFEKTHAAVTPGRKTLQKSSGKSAKFQNPRRKQRATIAGTQRPFASNFSDVACLVSLPLPLSYRSLRRWYNSSLTLVLSLFSSSRLDFSMFSASFRFDFRAPPFQRAGTWLPLPRLPLPPPSLPLPLPAPSSRPTPRSRLPRSRRFCSRRHRPT